MSDCWLFWTRFSLASGIALSSVLKINTVQAQSITSDGTLPTPTEVTENGDVTEITGGTARGSNLFHSFQDFSVDAGGTADFLNADSISNIFSRITGGNPSNIDGLIRTNNASLFFLNPAGIIFGAGASLDLGGGSFYGSTADSLLFEDGEFIATNTDNTPVLTVNAPIGLGFRDDPADISLTGTENAVDLADFSFLSVEENQSINLIGGNLDLNDAILLAPGGRIELGGLSASGTVEIDEDGSLNFPDNIALGNISLDNSGVFMTFSEDGEGGSIDFNANNINLLNGSFLQSGIDANLGSSEAQSGDINLNATGAININTSSIENNVNVNAIGNGDSINLKAGSLSLTEGSSITASTFGQGNPGNINIDIDNAVTISSGADIFNTVESGAVTTEDNNSVVTINAGSLSLDGSESSISASTFGEGNAGDINITTDNQVEIADGTIFSNVAAGAEGDGGNISINSDSLSLTQGGQIQASVREEDEEASGGQGDAGNINLDVAGEVLISGVSDDESQNPSAIFSRLGTGAVGDAGNINIDAGFLTLSDGASLDTVTFGEGNPGRIILDIDNAVTISSGADIFNTVESGAVTTEDNNSVVTINAGSLSLDGSGSSISASTFGQGNAGDINITTDNQVEITDGTIFSNVAAGAEGNGGNISINSDSLSLTQGGQIQASVREEDEEASGGQGDAGNINLDVAGEVLISGVSDDESQFSSGIFSRLGTGAVGNAGNIKIEAGSVTISDSGSLDNSTFGEGNAGDINISAETQIELINEGSIFSNVGAGATGRGGKITIDSNSLSASNNSFITTDTTGIAEDNERADAGDIEINVSESLEFVGGSSINSNTFGEGDAGNITINAEEADVSFDGINVTDDTFTASGLFSFVGAFEDENSEEQFINGGNIAINARSLSLNDGATIDSSTFGQGNAGNITINVSDSLTLSGRNRVEIEGVEQDIGSSIRSQAGDIFLATRAEGNAGSINIQAGSLTIDAGTIATGTSAIGNAGDITIDVTDFITLTDLGVIRSNVELLGIGDGGDINIKAKSLTLEEGGGIGAIVFREALGLAGGQGTAGNINIETSDSVTITGVNFDETLVLDPLDPTENFVETGFSSGVFADTQRGAIGNAGDITITTSNFSIADGAVVSASTDNQGNGGNININANTLDATGGGQVITTTSNQGNAGNINLNIADSINISGSDANFENRVNIVEPTLEGFSGKLEDIVNNQGAESGIFANTAPGSTGEGGSITIGSNVQPVANVFLADEGRIAANSDGAGDGGNIEFFVSDRLQLSGDSLISARSSTNSSGGNIVINADDGFVVAFPSPNNSQGNDIVADAQGGTGGNITIRTQGVLGLEEGRASNNNGSNDIDASGQTNGVVEIITPDVDAIQGAAELPTNTVEPDTSVAQVCSADKIARGSSLTVTGKGGIPPLPIEPLSSDLVLTQNPQAKQPVKPVATSIGNIYPARGVIVHDDGTFDLVAYATDESQRNLDRQTSCGKPSTINN